MRSILRLPGDRLYNLECQCGSRSLRRTFLIKDRAIECTNCGRTYACVPPILGIDRRDCECGPHKTAVVDSRENVICTTCGRHL